MARLHPADRAGGVRPRARPGRRDPEPPGHRGSAAASGVRRRAEFPVWPRARALPARFRAVRAARVGLALLAQGICRDGRLSDSARTRTRAPRIRRDAKSRLRGEGAGSARWLPAMAAAGAGDGSWDGPGPFDGGQGWTGGVAARPSGASASRHARPGGRFVQRSRDSSGLGTTRRELGMDGLPGE